MHHFTLEQSLARGRRSAFPQTGTIASGQRNPKAAGFTILEVAMAAFVMALGIGSSMLAMQTGFKALDVARDTTIASQILQSEMERLRLLPWNNSATTAVDSICELPSTETVNLATMFSSSSEFTAKFSVTRTVESDTARPADVRYITIRVQWRSYDGRTHNRSFRSMYAKNGLYDYYYTIAQ
jgi:Tfp pilus assembly protein PilV